MIFEMGALTSLSPTTLRTATAPTVSTFYSVTRPAAPSPSAATLFAPKPAAPSRPPSAATLFAPKPAAPARQPSSGASLFANLFKPSAPPASTGAVISEAFRLPIPPRSYYGGGTTNEGYTGQTIGLPASVQYSTAESAQRQPPPGAPLGAPSKKWLYIGGAAAAVAILGIGYLALRKKGGPSPL